MMKTKLLLTVIILMSTSLLNAQSLNDFRGLTWGMLIEEVKKLETAPLTNEEKTWTGTSNGKDYYDGVSLSYKNVTVGGKNSDIYYEFKNGRLLKVRIIYRPDLYTYDGKMSEIIQRFYQLFETFKNRQFKFTDPITCGNDPYTVWDANPDNHKILMMKDKNIDSTKLSLIDKMVAEKKYKTAFFRIANDRTMGLMIFYTKHSDVFVRAPALIELTPSFEVERKLKSDF